MKSLLILFVALAAALLTSCGTTPKENYQQAIDADLAEATVLMHTLRALDSGDVPKTRSMAMAPVLLNLDAVRYYSIKGMASLTAEQRQEWTMMARESLDYMLQHRNELDSRRLDVQAGLRLRRFLTQPEDVRRVDELSDHLARNAQTRLEAQKP
jgi:hypothetical protein